MYEIKPIKKGRSGYLGRELGAAFIHVNQTSGTGSIRLRK